MTSKSRCLIAGDIIWPPGNSPGGCGQIINAYQPRRPAGAAAPEWYRSNSFPSLFGSTGDAVSPNVGYAFGAPECLPNPPRRNKVWQSLASIGRVEREMPNLGHGARATAVSALRSSHAVDTTL